MQFKHSTRNRIEWKVKHIETDWQACKWTKGGTKPMFLQLERTVMLPGNRTRVETVWTYTDALKSPDQKGKWRV